MLWSIFLFNNRKGPEKYNKGYMKTWRSLVLVMRGHETKTKYTTCILSINTCKIFFQSLDVEEPNIFNSLILSKSPSQSLGCLVSENAPFPSTLSDRKGKSHDTVRWCAVKPRISSK